MRRLARRLLNLVTVLSLLLAVAVCVLWARSYRGWDDFERQYRTAASRTYREHSFVTHEGVTYLRLLRQQHDSGAVAAYAAPYGYAKRGDFRSRWMHERVFHTWQRKPLKPFWPDPTTSIESAGFMFRDARRSVADEGRGTVTYRCRTIACPIWCIVGLVLVLPTARVGSRVHMLLKRRCRNRPGHCPRCGYDLHATLGRCPECGSSPAA